MRAIEFNLGIPGCKQRLLWDDVLLTVRDRIPNDADVTLNLVVTKASKRGVAIVNGSVDAVLILKSKSKAASLIEVSLATL